MAKTTTAPNGFPDFTKAFSDFRLPGFDADAVGASQRKNLEALTQVGQIAAEGMQAVARRQAEIAQQTFAEVSALFHAWTQPGAPDQLVAKNVEVAKQAFEQGVANARELAELSAKAGTDAFSVIARRVSDSFDDARLYAKKLAAE